MGIDPIAQAVGMALGFVASFLAWYFVFHIISPKIEFSEFISKKPNSRKGQSEQTEYSYRFKFENCGDRTIVDVSVRARVRIKGIFHKQNWEIINLPIEDGTIEYFIPAIKPAQRKGFRTVLRFRPEAATTFNEPPYPDEIRRKALDKTLLLEDILKLGSKSELMVFVSGSDEFSGSRKSFSTTYRLDDIRDGYFAKGSLKILQRRITATKDQEHHENDDRLKE